MRGAERLRRLPRRDVMAALALTAAGELEALLAVSGGGDRLVAALAVPLFTLPLMARRFAPLLPLATGAVALLAEAVFGAFLGGQRVVPLAALVLALYAAGRHLGGARGFAAAVSAALGLAAIRIVADPSVDQLGEAALTVLATQAPVLAGRWARNQARLQRELEKTAARLERARERGALHAAEEERLRIAGDLEDSVAGQLRTIARDAATLSVAQPDARERLAGIAATARSALADVRRVLGVLRRTPGPSSLAPPRAAPPPSAAARAAGESPPARAPSASPAVTAPPIAAAATPPAVATSPGAPSPPRPPGSSRGDVALAAAVLLGGELELAFSDPLAALTPVAIAAPLLLRRRRPVAAGLAVLAAIALQSVLLRPDRFPAFAGAAVVLGAYAIGAHARRRASIAGLVLISLAAIAHALVFYTAGAPMALLGGVVVPWSVGRIARVHRRMTRELEERAALLERLREREARAAATAERMRVARELHDAVAHSISVIAIQAAGADGVLERDPRRAAQCVELIETVTRDALAELGRLAEPAAAPAQPSLVGLGALAQRARDGGLPVELRVEGKPGALPAGVDLAAYRIVQEALANASKHARAGHARVVVRYGRDDLEVEVEDDGRGPAGSPPPRDDAGHGLAGIRERVALYDGTLQLGRAPGGGFRVHARLPIGAA